MMSKNNFFLYVAVAVFLMVTVPAQATDTLQLKAIEPISATKVMPLERTAITPTADSGSATTTPPAETAAPALDPDVLRRLQAQKIIETRNSGKQDSQQDLAVKIQTMFSEYWVQMLALIVSVIGVMLAISGFSLANKKKRRYLKKFLHEIDDIYASYKWKTKRCEAEFYRLMDQVEDRLKAGQIDENTYHLLEARIQKYLDEIKEEAVTKKPADHTAREDKDL